MPLDHILRVFRVNEKTRFLTFRRHIEKLNSSIIFLLTILVQNKFKILHFGFLLYVICPGMRK